MTPRASGAGVACVDLRIVDRTRTTAAVGESPALACRVLPLEVRYPTAATTPLPLVVVAHGLDGTPGTLWTMPTCGARRATWSRSRRSP